MSTDKVAFTLRWPLPQDYHVVEDVDAQAAYKAEQTEYDFVHKPDAFMRSRLTPPPYPDARVEEMSNSDIITAFNVSLNELVPPSGLSNSSTTNIRRITTDAIVKHRFMDRSEFETMLLVSQHTSIPVPKVYRYIEPVDKDCDGYLCMQYIPGRSLDKVWPTLWWWQKLKVIWTLRGYVRQLCKIRSQTFPGPLAAAPKKCWGLLFNGEKGPFNSQHEMANWYNTLLSQAQSCQAPCRVGDPPRYFAPANAEPFDESMPLCMVHQDLTPQNVMLDEHHKVWLIDWGLAGFYPVWFEYANIGKRWDGLVPQWGGFVAGLIGGFYKRQARIMGNVSSQLNDFHNL